MENLVIRRYYINGSDKHPIKMPKGAQLLLVEADKWHYYVHALVNPNTSQTEKYYFKIYSVGLTCETKIQNDGFSYLGSASTSFGDVNRVIHVFYSKSK